MSADGRQSAASERPQKWVEGDQGSAQGFGTLASQLTGAKKQLAARRAAEAKAREEQERIIREQGPPKRKMTEAELMEEAFRAAGEMPIASAKFLGEGFDTSGIELVEATPGPDESADPSGAEPTQAELEFFEAMSAAEVRYIKDRDALKRREFVGAAWRTESQLSSLSDEELKHLEMTPAHRELLKRARRTEVEALNIRHLKCAEALKKVEAFVMGAAARKQRFVRVIHGKGRQSREGAVLKPEVIAWCTGPGARWVRAWAPEVDFTGQFGSIVIELHRS